METKTKQDYQSEIFAKTTPEEAFEKITRVQEWWSKNFEVKSRKATDVFTVRFPSGDMYKIRIAEIEPNKKIVWDVIDSYQGWVKDTSEWKGTKIVWEIKRENDGVSIDMTHMGLVPQIECFSRCKRGWDYLMQESLSKFLSEGKGLPV
jgi:hypothetical protein